MRLKCRWYKYQLEGLSSVSLRLTAPLRREPGGNFASAEARRWTEPVWQLSNRPRHPFGPPFIDCFGNKRQQIAAALSAAVISTQHQETAPT